MRSIHLARTVVLCVAVVLVAGCGGEKPIDMKTIMAQPKAFVGSDTCKMCHLEHYDSWKMTLHSRSIQDVQQNKDAIIVNLDENNIREDLGKLKPMLKVPADKIYIPKLDDVKYVMGSQWQQRFLVAKDGELFIAPIQYSVDTDRWV